MNKHVFISFAAVQTHDLLNIHLKTLLLWFFFAVYRARAPFGQHQESRPRKVQLSEHAQSNFFVFQCQVRWERFMFSEQHPGITLATSLAGGLLAWYARLCVCVLRVKVVSPGFS